MLHMRISVCARVLECGLSGRMARFGVFYLCLGWKGREEAGWPVRLAGRVSRTRGLGVFSQLWEAGAGRARQSGCWEGRAGRAN